MCWQSSLVAVLFALSVPQQVSSSLAELSLPLLHSAEGSGLADLLPQQECVFLLLMLYLLAFMMLAEVIEYCAVRVFV